MNKMRIAAALLGVSALIGCSKGGKAPESTMGATPAEAEGIENSAGSYPPNAPGVLEGTSGVGATGVEEPIGAPPDPSTPTP